MSRGGSYALNASALNSYYRRHNGTTNLPTNSDNNTGYRLVVETEEGNAAVTATGADRGSADSAAGYLETRFGDTVALAAGYGVSAIVQPGGSIRDEDAIRKADELGIVMLFTGVRHFKH